jgi:hypothetical protein
MDASVRSRKRRGITTFLEAKKRGKKKPWCVVNGASVGEEKMVPL